MDVWTVGLEGGGEGGGISKCFGALRRWPAGGITGCHQTGDLVKTYLARWAQLPALLERMCSRIDTLFWETCLTEVVLPSPS